ncbi:undecaprenyl-phosphate glucose phosphotransferase [Marinicellulosiphila megalodicopiae]|uniref:undecaprenyl-phosphate glucose phosphotransferase n=1 Tax=Marinicellulosiphila megalodicopiae TaxID=2724896 RepID=UPI003BB1FF8E
MFLKSTFSFDGGAAVLYRLIDALILVACFFSILFVTDQVLTKDYALLMISTLFVYTYLAESLQLYRSWRIGRFSKMLWLLTFTIFLTFLVIATLLFILKEGQIFSRAIILSWFTLSWGFLASWRIAARQIKVWRRLRGLSLQDVAIIGLTNSGRDLYRQMQINNELGFNCLGFFDARTHDRYLGATNPNALENEADKILGNFEDAIALARKGKIAKLYICLPLKAEERIAQIIAKLGDTTCDVLIVPDFLLNNLMHARIGSVGDVDTVSVFESPTKGIKEYYKRTFDLLFSACVILFISPILMMIAIAVKLSSKGPVLFKQNRYGLDGKQIGVYKFRSMTVMDNGAEMKQATKGDARITKVGAFLRKTSLDELPQFFNVLLGDMSVVGPRPHAVSHNEEYRKIVNFYMLRHKVRPGITGLAQVNGWRGETDTLEKMEMRVKYDLEYIRHWSLVLDIKIVFLTLFKGFVNKNAY